MEKLLHYIWANRLFENGALQTTSGKTVRIISPGLSNSDSGPDFFNAKIQYDRQTWAGNIEIHTRASDWIRHNHHLDKAYDSVILHVVGECDVEIFRTNGEPIPQLVITCSDRFKDDYISLCRSNAVLSCAGRLHEVDPLLLSGWVTALAVERLEQKTVRIFDWLDRYTGSWDEVCYITFARNLGFGINCDTFERLARSLPLLFIRKHADSLLQVEALLFGQAGLLDDSLSYDDYYSSLCREYQFLRHKFDLTPIRSEDWKFFRLRPANFPHQRLAMLAQLIHDGFSLFAGLCESKSEKELRKLFEIKLNTYWDTHFTFEHSAVSRAKLLGTGAVDIILINTVSPLLYAYGLKTGDEQCLDRAMELLENLRPEQNSIVRLFGDVGLKASNALESQALIQLRKSYCDTKKCLYCRVGHKLLSRSVRPV